MKILVLETKKGRAAVLDETGTVHNIKDAGYEAGQVLHFSESELKKAEKAGVSAILNLSSPAGRVVRFTRIAAAILILTVVSGSITAYAAPVSTVTMEGTGSVEYKLNLFDRVVSVNPTPGTDQMPTDDMSDFSREVKGMKISDAIDLTETRFGDELLSSPDESSQPEISIKVSGFKENNKHLNDEMGRKQDELTKKHRKPDSEGAGSGEDIKDAGNKNVSPDNAIPADAITDNGTKTSDGNTEDQNINTGTPDAADPGHGGSLPDDRPRNSVENGFAPSTENGSAPGSAANDPGAVKPESGTVQPGSGAGDRNTSPDKNIPAGENPDNGAKTSDGSPDDRVSAPGTPDGTDPGRSGTPPDGLPKDSVENGSATGTGNDSAPGSAANDTGAVNPGPDSGEQNASPDKIIPAGSPEDQGNNGVTPDGSDQGQVGSQPDDRPQSSNHGQ